MGLKTPDRIITLRLDSRHLVGSSASPIPIKILLPASLIEPNVSLRRYILGRPAASTGGQPHQLRISCPRPDALDFHIR